MNEMLILMVLFAPLEVAFLVSVAALGLFGYRTARFRKEPSGTGMAADEAVNAMTDSLHMKRLPVNPKSHWWEGTRHDPTQRAIFLPEEDVKAKSSTAVAVALHEAGHACQHATDYPRHVLWERLNHPLYKQILAIVLLIATLGLFLALLPTAPTVWAWTALGANALIAGYMTCNAWNTLVMEYDATRRALEFYAKHNGRHGRLILYPALGTYLGALLVCFSFVVLAVELGWLLLL